MKRIWVLDDNPGPGATVEKAAAKILAGADDLEVKRVSTVDALRRRVEDDTKPDLIITDLDMGAETVQDRRRPRESGLSAIRYLDENLPYVPFLIYSDINDYGGGRVLSMMAAFRFARPAGIVPKDSYDELSEALRSFFLARKPENEATIRYRQPARREERAIDVLLREEEDLRMWRTHAAGSGASSNAASKWRGRIIARALPEDDPQTMPEQLRMLHFPTAFTKDRKGNRNTKDPLMHFAIRHQMTFVDPAFEHMCRNNLWN